MNKYAQKYEFSHHETSQSYDVCRDSYALFRNFLNGLKGSGEECFAEYSAYKRFSICNDMMHGQWENPLPHIKPCPFCGTEINLDDLDDALHSYRVKDGMIWSLNCLECYGGCNAQMLGDTEKEVIEKWNRRRDSTC